MTFESATFRATAALAAVVLSLLPGPASANDMTTREVTVRIFETPEGERADFSDLVLTLLDLSGLDFKKAVLVGADLYGSDLSHANLSGTDLSSTRLDRTTIIGADFSRADFTDATLLRPSGFSSTSFDRSEAANFSGAKMVRTRIFARLGGASFRAADLTDADFSPLSSGANTISVVPFNILSGADFTDAVLRGANLEQVKLEYAIFRNADVRDVDFRGADLTGADFTGADVTGANFSGATVAKAVLSGAKGVQAARGLGLAVRPEDSELKRP
ncbi:MAG: pentapeptide repeat-containing protein [Alphaproteobacteria bacterium]|nr:pentapeptide repeat-containing protein [Alphaproteobacteria bacterium]